MDALVEQPGLPMAFGLRDLMPGDRAFVATTWGRSDRARAGCSKAVHARHHPAVVDGCLARGRTVVLCSPSVPGTVFGWACAEDGALHFAYVVPELQRRGMGRVVIATALGGYPDAVEVTHRWPWPSTRYIYNPFRLARTAS